MSLKVKTILAFSGLCFVTLFSFQNCAKKLPSGTAENSSSSLSILKINSPAQVMVGQIVNLSASGGTPPYTYTVDAGPASIVNSNQLQAGASQGLVNLKVVDAAGGVAFSSVNIVLTLGGGKICNLPWGGVVADGGSVTAYQAASVACQGGVCASETRICINGALSGSYANSSCVVPACAYRWFAALNNKETHAQACARVGKPMAANQGYGLCASGESRPVQGLGWDTINYAYGIYGAASTGGSPVAVTVNMGRDSTPTFMGYYCYRAGQVQDRDATDMVVAYLCRDN